MPKYREIVTKAVVGKTKKSSKNNYELIPEEKPDTILGCWVINHSFSGINNNGDVKINGSFDVNVWYSYLNNTKTSVSTKNYNYEDSVHVVLKDDTVTSSDQEIIVRCLKQPTVVNVNIDNNKVNLEIEKEMGVEIVGNTKVKISALDDYDDYDEDIDNINENYLDN